MIRRIFREEAGVVSTLMMIRRIFREEAGVVSALSDDQENI